MIAFKLILLGILAVHGESLKDLEKRYETLLKDYQRLEKKVRGRAKIPFQCQGRLTTESATPVSTTDQTGKSTIYFTPFKGNKITLYDGSAWLLYSFSEVSLALSGLTSGKNYDVFLYSNSGTLTLELSAAWTNDTTRADALAVVNGVQVKSSDNTRLYLGTLRTTGVTTTEDSQANRFLWNYCNRVERSLLYQDATASWTYASGTWRSANANASARVYIVVGLKEALLRMKTVYIGSANSVGYTASGLGIDSTSTNSAYTYGRGNGAGAWTPQVWSTYIGYPAVGYHYLQWLERGDNSGSVTSTFYGASAPYQAGMMGTIEG